MDKAQSALGDTTLSSLDLGAFFALSLTQTTRLGSVGAPTRNTYTPGFAVGGTRFRKASLSPFKIASMPIRGLGGTSSMRLMMKEFLTKISK